MARKSEMIGEVIDKAEVKLEREMKKLLRAAAAVQRLQRFIKAKGNQQRKARREERAAKKWGDGSYTSMPVGGAL